MPRRIAPWCIGCANCESACPVQAIVRLAADTFRIAADKCDSCNGRPEAECVKVCPSEAILLVKQEGMRTA